MLFRRKRKQSCWVYCPNCDYELCAGGRYVGTDMLGFEKFRCARCGTKSRWDFDPPAPYLIDWARPYGSTT